MKRKIYASMLIGAFVLTSLANPAVVKAEDEEAVSGTTYYGTSNDLNSTTKVKKTDENFTPDPDVEITEEITDIKVPVKATVANSGERIRYAVEISWGNMEFKYDFGGKWNSTDIKYETGYTAGWEESYYDGINNKIEVVNSSNYPITAAFKYVPVKGSEVDSYELADGSDGSSWETLFNAKEKNVGSVVGIFSHTNDTFYKPAGADADTDPAVDYINDDAAFDGYGKTKSKNYYTYTLNLDTNDLKCTTVSAFTDTDPTLTKNIKTVGTTRGDHSAVTGKAYFTLCGTPDNISNVTDDFESVGSINITVKPYKK